MQASLMQKPKVSRRPSRLTVPSQRNPADMRLTQNHGHDAVFHDCDEHIETVHQQENDAIPREYWKSDANLHWSDPRNELNRRHHKDADKVTAKDRSHYELSSELFDTERRTETTGDPATVDPLISSTSYFLQPDKEKVGVDHDDLKPPDRLRRNLRASETSTLRQDVSPPPEPPVEDEDPAFASRRRKEKNFSDMFGAQMPARDPLHRSVVTATNSCSWLDSRAEVEASRGQTHP